MNTKPQIGVAYDRSAWTLTSTDTARTYELRVRHGGDEDTFAFAAYDAGDEATLLTRAAYLERRDAIVEHEGWGACSVTGCADPDGAQYRVSGSALGVCQAHALDAEAAGVKVIRLAGDDAVDRAQALLRDAGVRVMWSAEERLMTELRAYWDAFALLFNPSVNL